MCNDIIVLFLLTFEIKKVGIYGFIFPLFRLFLIIFVFLIRIGSFFMWKWGSIFAVLFFNDWLYIMQFLLKKVI